MAQLNISTWLATACYTSVLDIDSEGMRMQPMIIDRLVNTQMLKIQMLIQTLFGIKANLVMCSMRNHM